MTVTYTQFKQPGNWELFDSIVYRYWDASSERKELFDKDEARDVVDMLLTDDGLCDLALVDRTLVGMSVGLPLRSENPFLGYFFDLERPALQAAKVRQSQVFWAVEMSVCPEHQDKGIGKTLAMRKVDFARDCGASLYSVQTENPAIVHIYGSLLGKPVKCVPYSSNQSKDYVFKL